MKKRIEKTITILVTFVLVVMLGASCVPDLLTPCIIEESVKKYCQDPNMPKNFWAYDNLWYSRQLSEWLDYTHITKQMQLERAGADDKRKVAYLQNRQEYHQAAAGELKKTLFSPTGAIGLLIPAGVGTFLGARFIPTPKEKKVKKELAKEKAKNNKTV